MSAVLEQVKLGMTFDADTFNVEPGDNVCIDGASFTAERDKLLPWIKNHKPLDSASDWSKASPVGDKKKFGLRPFPMRGIHRRHRFDFTGYESTNSLDVYPGGKRAWCHFDREVVIPVLATNFGETIMSFTPMEVLSMRQGWKRAKGNVLIGGLGLGVIARKALMRKNVKKVTIVEIDKDVIDLVYPSLKDDFGDRVDIIHADVYSELLTPTTLTKREIEYGLRGYRHCNDPVGSKPPKLPDELWAKALNYDSILIDIWNGVSGKYDSDDLYTHLAAHHRHVWGWGFKLYDNSRY